MYPYVYMYPYVLFEPDTLRCTFSDSAADSFDRRARTSSLASFRLLALVRSEASRDSHSDDTLTSGGSTLLIRTC